MAGRRVWHSLPAIAQILVAVAGAYSIAHWGLGHAVPILAVTLTINALGFSRDARPRRVAESVLGILLGVALSDGLSLLIGKGLWQLLVVLLVVFVVGRAVSNNVAFAVAAAVPSALVLLLPFPAGGPFGRTLDALVGGVVAPDLAARHLRTLARRVEFLVRDGVARPALAGLVHEVGTALTLLGSELDDLQLTGQARSLLSDLARRLDPAVVIPDVGIADAAIVLMLRPLVIDLLIGTGLEPDAGRALLPSL